MFNFIEYDMYLIALNQQEVGIAPRYRIIISGCQVIGQVKKNRKIGHCNPKKQDKNRIFLQKIGQK